MYGGKGVRNIITMLPRLDVKDDNCNAIMRFRDWGFTRAGTS